MLETALSSSLPDQPGQFRWCCGCRWQCVRERCRLRKALAGKASQTGRWNGLCCHAPGDMTRYAARSSRIIPLQWQTLFTSGWLYSLLLFVLTFSSAAQGCFQCCCVRCSRTSCSQRGVQLCWDGSCPGCNACRPKPVDYCAGGPCANGGTCKNGAAAHTCQCLHGFGGANCEIDLDECESDPCQNGGTCTDAINGSTCACVGGFSGVTCQSDIDA